MRWLTISDSWLIDCWDDVGLNVGHEFYWTSKRGSDRVGASRGRSAACASDTASFTSSGPFGPPYGIHSLVHEARQRGHCHASTRSISDSLVAGTGGFRRLRRNGLCKDEYLAGLLCMGAYGRAHE